MEMKKYKDIERLKTEHIELFCKEHDIVVQEKLDGANFSIRYDLETDRILSFSRKKQLHELETLRGAWNWSQTLDRNLVKKVLGNNKILFGEWLVPHTIKYDEEDYNKAYFYDVFDLEKGTYLKQDEVEQIVKELNLNYVPVFYKGKFQSWEHLKQFVGQTQMHCEQGEGIVVKNMSKLNSYKTLYVKIVTEHFSETKSIKKVNLEDIQKKNELQILVETVVTKARIIKILHKMVDEGLIPENFNEQSLSVIGKNIGKDVYYDCVKEESDVVEQVGYKFGQIAHKIAMKIARDYILEREDVV